MIQHATDEHTADFAARYAAAGLSVLPVKTDGSKSPIGKWEQWQERIATSAEINQLFCGRVGVGILSGAVSGNLECLDVDAPELVDAFEADVRAAAPGLLERLPTVATPRNNYGGRHYRYRLTTKPAGNTKLALSEPRPQFNKDGTPQIDQRTGKQRVAPDTLIETRGEGGMAIAPGSPGECHETGLPYKHVSGPPLTEVPTITPEEHELLWEIARSFNRHVEEGNLNGFTKGTERAASGGQSPGDDFNARARWADILEPAGWREVFTRGDVTHWRRPGKTVGTSATTGLKSDRGNDLLCVFSSNAHPFEGSNGKPCTTYTKFAAFALLSHNGDFGEATKALAAQGYGDQTERKTTNRGTETPKNSRKTPVLSHVTEYERFPAWALPAGVSQFVVEAAEAIGCDPSYVALPALSALAAAVGTTRQIRLKRSWSEPCVVWTAIVGDSGTQKSPAVEAPLKPLRKRQAAAIKQYQAELEAFKEDEDHYKEDLKAWHNKGKKSGEPRPTPPQPPVCERLYTNDSTLEALADRLSCAPRGLLVVRDELAGWLNSHDQYKGGRGGDVAHWLSLHGARDLIIDRKTGDRKTIYVPRAAVSITGGIQPSILRDSLGKTHFENGLAARFLLAMPPKRARRFSDADVAPAIENMLANLFDGLLSFEWSTDDQGERYPTPCYLTPDADRLWREFYDAHAIEQAELSGDLAAAWSKLEGYAARLALVVHCVKAVDAGNPDDNQVDADSMQAGITLSRWFGQEAQRVYGVMRESEEAQELRRLVERIRMKGGTTTARDTARYLHCHADEAEAMLAQLVKAGLARWDTTPTTLAGGRPGTVLTLITSCDSDRTSKNPAKTEDTGFSDRPADCGEPWTG